MKDALLDCAAFAVIVFLCVGFSARHLYADAATVHVHVHDWFRVGFQYRVNVQMPEEFSRDENRGRWSLTCDRGISPGEFDGTYDVSKNKLRLETADLKGRAQVTKCEVFSHDWRAPR